MAAEEPISTLVAIVGEENGESPFAALKDMRRDEQEALVAAARQYLSRKETLRDTIKQLEAAGITVNQGAFEFKTDERMEGVCLVLPVIDRARNSIEYLEQQMERYKNNARPQREENERLNRENRDLRRALERLTSGSVAPAQMVTHGD